MRNPYRDEHARAGNVLHWVHSEMRDIVHIEMPELEMNAPEAWWAARFLDREWLINEMQIATGVPHIASAWTQLKYGDEDDLVALGRISHSDHCGIINWIDRRAMGVNNHAHLVTIDLAREAIKYWRSHRNVA